MSKPKVNFTDNILGALNEVTSAMSSLNMKPEPIPEVSNEAYLSESDKWAQHAMEHLQAAFEYLAKEIQDVRDVKVTLEKI